MCSPKTNLAKTIILSLVSIDETVLMANHEGGNTQMFRLADIHVWMVSTICSTSMYVCQELQGLSAAVVQRWRQQAAA